MVRRNGNHNACPRRTFRTQVVTCVSGPDMSRRAHALFRKSGQEHGRDVERPRAEAELLEGNRT